MAMERIGGSSAGRMQLGKAGERIGRSLARLSTGLRIATAADDPAGLGISERMRATMRSYETAGRNTMDGVSLARTAEADLGQVQDNVGRMRELATRAASGTLSDADRASLNDEFQKLGAEVERVAGESEYNGQKLLDGSTSGVSIQVGDDAGEAIDVDLPDVTSGALGDLASLDISTAGGAEAALAGLDAAGDEVSGARGDLGAAENRLRGAYSSISRARENTAASESRIRDVDYAKETSGLAAAGILANAAVAMQAHGGLDGGLALRLLGR